MPEGGGLDHATPVVGAVVTAAHVRRRSLAGDDQLADATGRAMTSGAARRDTATPTSGRQARVHRGLTGASRRYGEGRGAVTSQSTPRERARP